MRVLKFDSLAGFQNNDFWRRGCNAGYYKKSASGILPNQCVSCASTAGTYMSAAGASTACTLCSNKPASSGTYYLKPIAGGFNGMSNNCPWYFCFFTGRRASVWRCDSHDEYMVGAICFITGASVVTLTMNIWLARFVLLRGGGRM